MVKNIVLEKENISYSLKTSKRARHLRLAVYCSGELVVTKPWYIGEGAVEKFLLKKADWVLRSLAKFKNNQKDALGFSNLTRTDYLKNKENARRIIISRLEHFNHFYQFKYQRVSIRDQKTRWGSCSKRGNLNFNYRLVFMPEESLDYVVVHELCHLREMNHSARFWNLVAQKIPNYKENRKNIKFLL